MRRSKLLTATLLASALVVSSMSAANAARSGGENVTPIVADTYQNGTADNGGAFYQTIDSVVNAGAVFKNNTATSKGGAIYNSATMEIGNNVTFQNNIAASDGNDIFNHGGSITIGDNLSIIHDAPYDDCNIYSDNGGYVKIGNNAIFNGGGDGIVMTGPTSSRAALIVGNNSKFSNFDDAAIIAWSNTDAMIGTDAAFDNTGLAIQNSRNSSTTVGDGFVVKNAGNDSWGAILNRANDGGDGTTTIDFLGSATIQNNTNTGLYNRLGAITTFNGETLFDKNSTAGNGGAIRNVDGTSTYNSTVIFNYKAEFTDNSAVIGGAIYNAANGVIKLNEAAIFDGNSAYQKGGAIYNSGKLEIASGTLFSNNETTWDGAAGSGEDKNANGGAIWNSGTITMGDNITFLNNHASSNVTSGFGHGSDIYITSGNVTIGNNLLITRDENYAYSGKHDCAIMNYGSGILTIGNNAEISNVAEAIITSDDAKVYIGDNLHIHDVLNGIASWGKDIEIGKNAILENVTEDRVFQNITGSGKFVFDDGLIVRNNVNIGSNSFGTIYNEKLASMEFGSAEFINNKAPLNNAGLFQNWSKLTFNKETLLKGNMANGVAGALRNRGTASDTIFKDAVTFADNAATGNGGAVLNQGILTFDGAAKFSGNIAGGLAGYIEDESGVFVDSEGNRYSWTIDGVNTSSAANGGAIHNDKTVVFNDKAEFSKNAASGLGGAIYNEGTVTFNDEAVFSGNTAGSSANDIYNKGTIVFNAGAGKTSTLEGGIDGVTNGSTTGLINMTGAGTVNIAGNLKNQTVTVSAGELHLSNNNNLTGSTVSIASDATINSIDGAINDYTGNITLADGSIVKADIDLSGTGSVDTYSGTGTGTINLIELNVVQDTTVNKTLQIATGVTNVVADNLTAYTSANKYTVTGSTDGSGEITLTTAVDSGGLNAAVDDTTAAAQKVTYNMTDDEMFAAAADTTIQNANFTINGNDKTVTAAATAIGITIDNTSVVSVQDAAFEGFDTDNNGAFTNNGVLNLDNVSIDDSNAVGVLNKTGATLNVNGGSNIESVVNSGTTNIAEGANVQEIENAGTVTMKIIDYVDQAQSVDTLITNTSGSGTGDTIIDLQLSEHGATESDGVTWTIAPIGMEQNSVTFTGDGHLGLIGGKITANIICKMTGNTLVINNAIDGSFTNDDTDATPHAIFANGSSVSGTVTNDGLLEITAGTFDIENGVANTAAAKGTLTIGDGVNTTVVNLLDGTLGDSIVQNALNISNNAVLNANIDNLTITTGIANEGTLNIIDGTAISNNITGNGITVIDAYNGVIGWDADTYSIDNVVDLELGTLQSTTASGNMNFAGVIANGGNLDTRDNQTGTINLGVLDLSNDDLRVNIDADLGAAAGPGDVLAATSVTGSNSIVIESINALNYVSGAITSYDINIADSVAKDYVDFSITAITGTGTDNMLFSYSDVTGNISGGVATLASAVTSPNDTKMYALGTSEDISGAADLTLGGTSLSVTADGTTITGGDAAITLANANQTLSISGGTVGPATITGFTDTAIDNSAGGTVGLRDVNMTGNGVDVVNAGILVLAGANTLGSSVDNIGTIAVTDSSVINDLENSGVVTGPGIVNLTGDSVNSGTIETVVINSAASNLANTGVISGTLTNNGNLDNSGTMSGSVINNSVIANSGVISGSVTNNSVIDNSGTISADIANGGLLTTTGIVTGNINNDGVIDISGGTVLGDVVSSGSGGLIFVNADTALTSTITNQTIGVTDGNTLTTSADSVDYPANALVLLDGSTLNVSNNAVESFQNANLDLATGVSNLKIDADMSTGKFDNFASVTSSSGGKVAITDINLMGKMPKSAYNGATINLEDVTGIDAAYIADSKVSGTVLTPIRKLEGSITNALLTYAPVGGGNGYSTFNPSVLAGPIAAQMGGYLSQLNSYEEAFRNLDMKMLMTREERQAYKMANRYAGTVTPQVFSETYLPEKSKAAWFRPYASFENVDLKGGTDVGNTMYGSFFGGDSQMYELNHGWDFQYSVYAGYNGSHQTYDGVGIYQNGGNLGVTGVWYKDNFFTALTANAGASVADANTMYGHEDFPMLMAGVASKTGYNWELAHGKFIIQPSYMMSYTFVNTFDYTNAAGVKIDSDPLHAIHIQPGLKFIGNLKNGWQPYLGVSMVWNIMDQTRFTANDVSLPDMSVRPYVQYGVGVQKRWGERFTGFLQAMIRNGGRNGIALSAGFRWAIGSEPGTKTGGAAPQERQRTVIKQLAK